MIIALQGNPWTLMNVILIGEKMLIKKERESKDNEGCQWEN